MTWTRHHPSIHTVTPSGCGSREFIIVVVAILFLFVFLQPEGTIKGGAKSPGTLNQKDPKCSNELSRTENTRWELMLTMFTQVINQVRSRVHFLTRFYTITFFSPGGVAPWWPLGRMHASLFRTVELMPSDPNFEKLLGLFGTCFIIICRYNFFQLIVL